MLNVNPFSVVLPFILNREIIKAGSKGRKSGPKVGSKFGQSNNNTKHAPIGMKFGTLVEYRLFFKMRISFDIIIIYFSHCSMKYTTMSLILGSGPTFAVLTMSRFLQIIVSLEIPHELFDALSIQNMSKIRKNIKIK